MSEDSEDVPQQEKNYNRDNSSPENCIRANRRWWISRYITLYPKYAPNHWYEGRGSPISTILCLSMICCSAREALAFLVVNRPAAPFALCSGAGGETPESIFTVARFVHFQDSPRMSKLQLIVPFTKKARVHIFVIFKCWPILKVCAAVGGFAPQCTFLPFLRLTLSHNTGN